MHSWNVVARLNLGCFEFQAGNYDRAYKHYILSARAGHNDSLDKAKQGFMQGVVTKDEYANTFLIKNVVIDEKR